MSGQVQRAGQLGQDEQAQEERRLGQAGEGHLARRPHPLERRAGVEGGRGGEEAAQAEQVREQDQVAGERDRRAGRWPSGIRSTASAAVTRPTTGPARKTQVVVVLKTEPFRKSLTRS